jgi:hypothetical protein
MEGRAHAAACSLGAQRALCDSNRPAGARRGGLGGGWSGERQRPGVCQGPGAQGPPRRPPRPAGIASPRVPAGPSPRRTPSARGRGAGRLARPRGRPEGMAGPGGQGHAQACGLWAGPGLSPLAPSDPRSTRPSLRGLQCGAGRGPACDPAGQGDFSPAGAGRWVRRCVPPGGQGHPCTTSAGRPVGRSRAGRSVAGRSGGQGHASGLDTSGTLRRPWCRRGQRLVRTSAYLTVCRSGGPSGPPLLPSTDHRATSRGSAGCPRPVQGRGAGETATGTRLDHTGRPRGRPTRGGQGSPDSGQGDFSRGGGGGGGGSPPPPPPPPLYLAHLWSDWQTEGTTAFLAPRRPKNHNTPDPRVDRCNFRGWDR